MVKAWIKQYRKADDYNKHKDCHHCGYPHNPYALCNNGTFGEVWIGVNCYSISLSNIVYMLDFMKNLGKDWGFRQKNERFFKRVGDMVEVRFFEYYNNTPQERLWQIPINEWNSINKFIEQDGANE